MTLCKYCNKEEMFKNYDLCLTCIRLIKLGKIRVRETFKNKCISCGNVDIEDISPELYNEPLFDKNIQKFYHCLDNKCDIYFFVRKKMRMRK